MLSADCQSTPVNVEVQKKSKGRKQRRFRKNSRPGQSHLELLPSGMQIFDTFDFFKKEPWPLFSRSCR